MDPAHGRLSMSHGDGDKAGMNHKMLAYICKDSKCTFYRKAVYLRATGEFKVTMAEAQTDDDPAADESSIDEA